MFPFYVRPKSSQGLWPPGSCFTNSHQSANQSTTLICPPCMVGSPHLRKRQGNHWKNLQEAEADGLPPRRCIQCLCWTSWRKIHSLYGGQLHPRTLTPSSSHRATALWPPFQASQLCYPSKNDKTFVPRYLQFNIKSLESDVISTIIDKNSLTWWSDWFILTIEVHI